MIHLHCTRVQHDHNHIMNITHSSLSFLYFALIVVVLLFQHAQCEYDRKYDMNALCDIHEFCSKMLWNLKFNPTKEDLIKISEHQLFFRVLDYAIND